MSDVMSGNKVEALRFNPAIAGGMIYKGGESIETVRARYGLDEVYKLASNENPLATPPQVYEAIAMAAQGLNRYPPMGDDELRGALAAYVGRGVRAKQIVTGNGGCDVLFNIARAFLGAPGDEAIICPPTFPVYEWSVRRVGATLVEVPLLDGFRYDVAGILGAVTERTRLLYLCSPNNPTGSILHQVELDALMAGLPDGVLVVADEVYHHFNTAEVYADSFGYLEAGENIAILHSFSKVFGLAGLRLGYAVTQPEIAEYLAKGRLPFHVNALTMVGAQAGLGAAEYVAETVALTVRERQRLYEGLLGLGDGVEVFPSESNFILFRPLFDRGTAVARALQKRGVIVRGLGGFYLPGYLRVSVGLAHENERFLAELAALMGV